jgi:hypothetical protein
MEEGRFGNPVIDEGGILVWTSGATLSDPNPSIINSIPESNATLPS